MTDIIIGGKCSGIMLANQIRQTRPAPPILVISGVADSTITSELADPARVAWLAKPFSLHTVSQSLRGLLDVPDRVRCQLEPKEDETELLGRH